MTEFKIPEIPCLLLEKAGTMEETVCPYSSEFNDISNEYSHLPSFERDSVFHETYCKYCLMQQQAEASKDMAEALDQIFSFMVTWYK